MLAVAEAHCKIKVLLQSKLHVTYCCCQMLDVVGRRSKQTLGEKTNKSLSL